MTPRRPPNPHLDALADFFAHADADQGLRSSFGPLADMARGGFGGGSAADPERNHTDRRFGLGPGGEGTVTRARAIRAALATLPAVSVDVLFARHGPTPWGQIIDRAFGKGMAIKVQARLGDLAGIALLAPSVARGFAGASSQPRRAAWDTPGGWLVALCLDNKARPRCATVRAEAASMLADAERLYLAAMGAVLPGHRGPQQRPARRPPPSLLMTLSEADL